MDEKMETKLEMQDFKDPGYEIFIIFVSVLSVINLILIWIPGFDPDAVHVVEVINFFLTIIFLVDFAYRLFTAGSKRYYFFRDWGWADLLASIPALRILRLFRIFKAYRLLKKYGVHNIFEQLKKHRANSMFYIVIFCVILVIELGAFLVLQFEQSSPNANIQTASDALWWTCVTITTVGYGDRFPTTNAGRLVGIAIMAMGVALIGTLAGFIANKLLAPDMSDTQDAGAADSNKTGVVEGIHNALKEQHRQNMDLQERLDRIEQQLKGKSP
jgi:voltage-gated potassium channel